MKMSPLAAAAASALFACASSSSTAPHAMSAAEHDALARREEAASAEIGARYDEGAWARRDCPRPYGTLTPVCWADARNPTARYLERAARRHEEAERHRAASRALREAEAAACAEVAPSDREWSPFEHTTDLVSVEPLTEKGQDTGVVATFRAAPGLTSTFLKRLAECHAARNAVLGHARAEMAHCPLSVAGVQIDAFETPHRVALVLRAADPDSAKEMLERARGAISR